jgi:curli production assembly/transport component CsgG
MKKLTLLLLAVGLISLSGCAVVQSTGLTETRPEVTKSMMKKEFDTLPPPSGGKPVTVAIYGYTDKTGQRKMQTGVASFSTAVTQGAETFLIQALQNVGKSRWFDVVERVGIDNLVKERTIIKQMREAYEGAGAKALMPMQFAGIIIEGGIIGFDSSNMSGGAGMRIFGIGKQTQWSQDTVTVSLRAVSVNTGKVLATVTVQKTILSTADSATALKFFDAGTQAFEAEMGLTINEPGTYAVKAATEFAVVELIKEGARKGVWNFKYPLVESKPYLLSSGGFEPEPKQEEPKPAPVEEVKKEAPPPEVKKEEPKAVEVKKPEPKIEVKVEPKAVEVKKPEIKTEPKVEPKVEPKSVEVKKPGIKLEIKVEPKAETKSVDLLYKQRILKEDSFLHAEENEASQRRWQFRQGTIVTIRQVGNDGWIKVVDSEFKGGWVKMEAVKEVPPVVGGNAPEVKKQ